MSVHFDGTEPREWDAAMTMVGRSIAATVGPRVPRDEDLQAADDIDVEYMCDGDAFLLEAHFSARKWWRL